MYEMYAIRLAPGQVEYHTYHGDLRCMRCMIFDLPWGRVTFQIRVHFSLLWDVWDVRNVWNVWYSGIPEYHTFHTFRTSHTSHSRLKCTLIWNVTLPQGKSNIIHLIHLKSPWYVWYSTCPGASRIAYISYIANGYEMYDIRLALGQVE